MVKFSSKAALALGLALAVVGAAVFHVFGQSPAASARAVLNGTTIEIRYSAPSARGRRIFGPGGVLSSDWTYPIWRAGANAATTLVTTGNLQVGDLAVPAGTYTLFVLLEDPDAWTLIVSRQTGQWGLSYDQSRDLGRVAMTMSKPPALVEVLTYTIADRGNGRGELRLAWEHRAGTVPVKMR